MSTAQPWQLTDPPCAVGSVKRRKIKSPSAAQEAAKKVRHAIGVHSYMVKRHRKNGTVSSNHKNNIFITAGSVKNILRSALEEEYPGGLCESSLLSHREGDQRFMLCDCKGKSSHDFPSITGPRDRARWARVVTKSKKKLKP